MIPMGVSVPVGRPSIRPTMQPVSPRPARELTWVVLTTGGRPDELRRAVASVVHDGVVVVANGCPSPRLTGSIETVELPENVGVPAGRDVGVAATRSRLVGFLDDDAELLGAATDRIVEAFDADPRLGAVALRLVDEHGTTSRRHVPRPGRGGADRSGEVAHFLGGACVVRAEAYHDVGGYFTDLFYGHEELELAWRLIDAGWRIRYLADIEVFHPHTEIARHERGWWLTGRNRVWVARRSLPWPVAVVHTLAWLALGARRAPTGACRKGYVAGWRAGWSDPIPHRPIGWRAVWRLTRLGRPPVI